MRQSQTAVVAAEDGLGNESDVRARFDPPCAARCASHPTAKENNLTGAVKSELDHARLPTIEAPYTGSAR